MGNLWTKSLLRLTSPVAAIALLSGMVAEHRSYLREEDFARYHERAKASIEAVPVSIGSWSGMPTEVVKEAQKLLKPNCILSRKYEYLGGIGTGEDRPDKKLTLLIVQCKRSGDMVGHYPRNCYRSIGNEMTKAEPREWDVDGLRIPITEYHFRKTENRRTAWTIVYNFMIVPGRGIVRDMDEVKAAAEDYQQRYYGAAQFQLVFHAPLPQQERDEIFSLFLRALVPTIKTLNSGALQ
jgi:hypothetical protein